MYQVFKMLPDSAESAMVGEYDTQESAIQAAQALPTDTEVRVEERSDSGSDTVLVIPQVVPEA